MALKLIEQVALFHTSLNALSRFYGVIVIINDSNRFEDFILSIIKILFRITLHKNLNKKIHLH